MKSQEKYEDSELYKIRHTAAHVLAMAAKEFDPKVKLAIGPPIENGFYYDFEFSKPISDTDLPKLEKSMAKIIAANHSVEHKLVDRQEALAQAKKDRAEYKAELIEGLTDVKLGYYGIDTFWDLCKGPHVSRTGKIKVFKLLSLAGAYWRGDENQPMLTRIYGTAFANKKDLEDYLQQLEEAKKYDHRRLGKELGIFMISPKIGSGLPVWLPKGATLYRLLSDYIRSLEIDRGYQHVITSELGKIELYQTSGHLDHYADSMYPPIKLDNETFILRPMNCPHHIEIYASELRSYKQLPTRLAEFGEVFRYEKSGELSGLQRVRGFTINDSHIFCREEQIKEECKNVITLIQEVYAKLGLTDYWFRLSLHDPNNTKKYSNNFLLWEKSEKYLRETLQELKVDFIEATDEAAYYGPKLDVQMKNILGKEETISTVQLDFYLPERFDIEYIDEKGQKARPVMIHRAIIGSMERFIGVYLEKTKGELPLWLSPVQVKILPISEKTVTYAEEVKQQLRQAGLRVELDDSNESLGKRIRQGEMEKTPYLLIVGEKEAEGKTITARIRHEVDQKTTTVKRFIDMLANPLD